jgi:hypothetical protein
VSSSRTGRAAAATSPSRRSSIRSATKRSSLAYRDMLVTMRDKVAKLKQQGRSLDETIAAKPTAAFDAKWGQFVITPAFFTRLVYQGV